VKSRVNFKSFFIFLFLFGSVLSTSISRCTCTLMGRRTSNITQNISRSNNLPKNSKKKTSLMAPILSAALFSTFKEATSYSHSKKQLIAYGLGGIIFNLPTALYLQLAQDREKELIKNYSISLQNYVVKKDKFKEERSYKRNFTPALSLAIPYIGLELMNGYFEKKNLSSIAFGLGFAGISSLLTDWANYKYQKATIKVNQHSSNCPEKPIKAQKVYWRNYMFLKYMSYFIYAQKTIDIINHFFNHNF